MDYCYFCGESTGEKRQGIHFCGSCDQKITHFMKMIDGPLTDGQRSLVYDFGAEIIRKKYKNFRFYFGCYEDCIQIRGYLDTMDPDDADESDDGCYDDFEAYIVSGDVGFAGDGVKIRNLSIEYEYQSENIANIKRLPKHPVKQDVDWDRVAAALKCRFPHAPPAAVQLMKNIFADRELPHEESRSWMISFDSNNSELPEKMPSMDYDQADALWLLSGLCKYGGDIEYGDQTVSVESDPLESTIFLFHPVSERTYQVIRSKFCNNFNRVLASEGWAVIAKEICETDLMFILCRDTFIFERYYFGIFDLFTGNNILDRIAGGAHVGEVFQLYLNGCPTY